MPTPLGHNTNPQAIIKSVLDFANQRSATHESNRIKSRLNTGRKSYRSIYELTADMLVVNNEPNIPLKVPLHKS